jgi:hypothetical protein
MSDTAENDASLDRALRNVESVEDQQAIRDFAAFLASPASRCMICLTDDAEGATWKTHPRLGRGFICRTCVTPPGKTEEDA